MRTPTTLALLGPVVAAAAAALLPAPASAAAQTVRVSETDYRIVLGGKPRAGLVTFVIRNTGDHDHDFRLRGGGISKRTPLLEPGQTARIRVRLQRGVRYRLLCAPHADRGMRSSFVAR